MFFGDATRALGFGEPIGAGLCQGERICSAVEGGVGGLAGVILPMADGADLVGV